MATATGLCRPAPWTGGPGAAPFEPDGCRGVAGGGVNFSVSSQPGTGRHTEENPRGCACTAGGLRERTVTFPSSNINTARLSNHCVDLLNNVSAGGDRDGRGTTAPSLGREGGRERGNGVQARKEEKEKEESKTPRARMLLLPFVVSSGYGRAGRLASSPGGPSSCACLGSPQPLYPTSYSKMRCMITLW